MSLNKFQKKQVSSLTLYELWKKQNPSSRLIDFIKNLQSIPFDDRAAAEASIIFKTMKEKGKPINEIDILIASVAISKNYELITTDSDFPSIKKFSKLKLNFFKKP